MATLTLACVQTSSSGQQINEVKKVEQSPACRRAESFFTTHLDQRFPLHGGATTDIAADDWRQFFEAGGLLERALLYAKADRKTSQLRHLLRQLETRPISLRYSGSNGMTAEWNRVPWKPGRWRRMPSLGTEHRLAWTVGQEGDSQSLRYRGPWAWLHALRGATKMGNRASIRTYRLTMGDSRPPVHLSVRLPGLHQEPLTLLRQLRGRLATFFERCMLAYPHHNRGKKEEI